MSDSSRPHRLQPTRFLHPWDFPYNSTGVGAFTFSARFHIYVLIHNICFPLSDLLHSVKYKIILAGKKKKHINYLEESKSTWNISLLKKIEFWEDVIMNLPEKWQKVVKQNSEYMVQ